MKISGFTIIRNAVLMDYPIVESIRSLLPLVDELVVGVGNSDDETLQLIESISDSKIKIFQSHWDSQSQTGGLILSEKTNEALARCGNDWCIYLQGDEVIHEDDYPAIREALGRASQDPRVEGLLFRYIHFYASHSLIATSRNWYRHEIRAVRKSSGIQSVGDAQGFRVHGRKATVIDSGARIFHYGWVKPPDRMRRKKTHLDRLWHGTKRDLENEGFDFQRLYGLREFKGSHPKVMKERVQKQDWAFSPSRSLGDWTWKDLNLFASDVFEKIFRIRIGEYKNYRRL